MSYDLVVSLAIFGTLLLGVLVAAIILYVSYHNKSVLKQQQRLREEKFKHEELLLRSRFDIQEEVLDWASREIHDNVGQVLSVTRLQLEQFAEQPMDEKKTMMMRESASRIGECLQSLRRLSQLMNGAIALKGGLEEAIEKELCYVGSLGKGAQKSTYHFSSSDALPKLSPEENLLIFRIFQEALHNIITHAQATVVDIHMAHRDERLTLSIRDNGVGMDLNNLAENSGLGLVSMRQRAKRLGGTLDIQSHLGKGSIIQLTIKFTHQWERS